jgi:hypothetical protein
MKPGDIIYIDKGGTVKYVIGIIEHTTGDGPGGDSLRLKFFGPMAPHSATYPMGKCEAMQHAVIELLKLSIPKEPTGEKGGYVETIARKMKAYSNSPDACAREQALVKMLGEALDFIDRDLRRLWENARRR